MYYSLSGSGSSERSSSLLSLGWVGWEGRGRGRLSRVAETEKTRIYMSLHSSNTCSQRAYCVSPTIRYLWQMNLIKSHCLEYDTIYVKKTKQNKTMYVCINLQQISERGTTLESGMRSWRSKWDLCLLPFTLVFLKYYRNIFVYWLKKKRLERRHSRN